MHDKYLCTLLLALFLTACSSSGDDHGSPDNPPADDPVSAPDCLGDIAVDGTTYCVDPVSRTVTATQADGTVDWTNTLADSEFSSKIDTLVLIGGQPWLLADSGRLLGQVRPDREYVSHGQAPIGSGEFIQSSPSYDFDYQRDDRPLPAIGIGNSAYIATDVYVLIAGADRTLDDSWQFLGASLQRIEPVVGYISEDNLSLSLPIRAQRLYPDRHVQSLARTVGGQLLVEFDDASEILTADTLLPKAGDPARALLGGQPHEAVAPYLVTALRGDGLDDLAQQMLALGEQVRASASDSLVIESNAPDEILPREELDIVERIDYVCTGGGELGLERTERLTFNSSPGVFPRSEILERYRYTDCHVTIGDDDPLLASGSYRLDGEFTYYDLLDVVFQNFSHARTRQEWQQLSLDGPLRRSSLTTAETILDIELVVSPPPPIIRTTRIELHEEHIDGELALSVRDGAYANTLKAPFGGTQPYLQIVASGTITASATGNQSIEVSTDPPFERSIVATGTDTAPGVRSTGRLLATAADGSTMTVTAVEAIATYTGNPPSSASAILDYLITDGDAVLRETKTLNSLDIPVSLP
ncbi:MAG: hypothetical protein HKN42_02870 [Granulosicoccus sp.]|nr:hypothetical protein [Granulosicoccus sp.]